MFLAAGVILPIIIRVSIVTIRVSIVTIETGIAARVVTSLSLCVCRSLSINDRMF